MDNVARRRAAAAAAAVLFAAFLFAMSSRPTVPLPAIFPHADKLIHAVAYGVLGLLVACAVRSDLGWRRAGLALALAVAFGASDEWHQGFVPGRDPSLLDLAADTIGAAAGILLVARRARRED